MAKIDIIIGCLPKPQREPARSYVDILLAGDNIDGLVECVIRGEFQAAYEYIVAQMDGTHIGAAHGRIHKMLKERDVQRKPKMSMQQGMVAEALTLLLKVGAVAVNA